MACSCATCADALLCWMLTLVCFSVHGDPAATTTAAALMTAVNAAAVAAATAAASVSLATEVASIGDTAGARTPSHKQTPPLAVSGTVAAQ